VLGTADPATQQRRRRQLAATLAGVRLRATVLPDGSLRRRQSLQVCSAARILTALGVRVRVVQPATPWPRDRAHRLVTADVGRLGDLAVLTAVPRTTHGWTTLAERVLPGRPAARTGEPPEDAVLCPVAVHARSAAGPLDVLPRSLAEAVAARDLVVEVHLLPALAPVALPGRELVRAA
jgi:hypothetical protein